MARPINTKVLIVDDQPLFCLGLSTLLESTNKFNILGTAATIAEALKITEKECPKLVIMEVRLGNENGMDLIKKIKTEYPEIIILILSTQNERYYSERLLRLGVRGYIMKTASTDDVMEAIQTVLDGKVYLSESERERIFQAITGDSAIGTNDWTMSLHKLSNRELQVFSLIGKGLGTIEIATRFNLSTKTIDTYKEHIKIKLHCSTSQELRQLAIEWANQSGA
jgi:DNA-binding NarL/FixJ family response regulator